MEDGSGNRCRSPRTAATPALRRTATELRSGGGAVGGERLRQVERRDGAPVAVRDLARDRSSKMTRGGPVPEVQPSFRPTTAATTCAAVRGRRRGGGKTINDVTQSSAPTSHRTGGGDEKSGTSARTTTNKAADAKNEG